MLYELPPEQYGNARPLFQPLADQPFCTAVLARIHPGRVLVDDRDHPQTAAVSRQDPWFFLAGDPENPPFNRALNEALSARRIVRHDVPYLLITAHPGDWHGQLSVVFNPRRPLPAQRRHYVCRELNYDWRADVPSDFTVQPMDDTLLDRPGLIVPEEVSQTIEQSRSIAGTRFRDFGFVVLSQDAGTGAAKVVSWATVDAIVDGVGDAGLFTLEDYRRRGLAAIAAAAAVEHGLSHGMLAVHWTCDEDNIGSIRTAEKLGFERQRDYTLYYVYFDQAEHRGAMEYTASRFARKAEAAIKAGQYAEAASHYDQVLALRNDASASDYHLAARAWAALGNTDRATEYLHEAAGRGWDLLYHTRTCKEFKFLHGSAGWTAVLDRIQQNRSGVGTKRPGLPPVSSAR
jgi:RimJ/RimL family protein N-acetyltransferase